VLSDEFRRQVVIEIICFHNFIVWKMSFHIGPAGNRYVNMM
jgi:hypothetical protein